jgi:hypothetical protein
MEKIIRKIRTYSNNEKEHIFKVCSEAKEKGLEMKTVFIGLADQYDCTFGAISQLYYGMAKKRKGGNVTQLAIDMDKPERVIRKPIKIREQEPDLITALETLIAERNFYKSKYDEAMKLLGL